MGLVYFVYANFIIFGSFLAHPMVKLSHAGTKEQHGQLDIKCPGFFELYFILRHRIKVMPVIWFMSSVIDTRRVLDCLSKTNSSQSLSIANFWLFFVYHDVLTHQT